MGSTPLTASVTRWLVRSRQPVSLPEGKLPVSSLLPRLPVSQHLPLVERRNLTGTDLAQWLCVRSEDTRSPQSCSSASYPSSAWSVRLPRTSKLTSGSRVQLLELSKKQARPIWLVCLRIQTCAPSTPSVSPSCPRISSWPGGSGGRGLRKISC